MRAGGVESDPGRGPRKALGRCHGCRHFAEAEEWGGKLGYFKRIATVNRTWKFQSRTAAAQAKEGRPIKLRQKVISDGRVLLL